MAKLDIIMPHYKEDIHLMDQMLGILKLQRNVKWSDFRVLIVCDGEDIEIPEGFGQDMPYEVTWIHIPHGGISAARNAGLDAATADWIMFCDTDDAFMSTTALQTYFRFMTDDKVAVFSSFFEEAHNKEGRMVLLWHSGKDFVFVHGKAFRRSWLNENHIRFNNDLQLHEDSYFIALARYHLDNRNVTLIKDPLYLWQWNDNSVTRKCDNFVLMTYDQLCKKNTALIKELWRRGMIQQATSIVCRTITDAYCRLNSKSWNAPGNEEKIKTALGHVARFYREHEKIFKGTKSNLVKDALNDLRTPLIKGGDFDEATVMLFEEWVEMLRRTGEENEH